MVSTNNKPSNSLDKRIALTESEIPSGMERELKNQEIVSLSNIRAKRAILFPPAFRLPPETLEIIFILGAYDYYESEDDFYSHYRLCVPTWVTVSYVCRHWRNIALNCPTLWTYQFNTPLRWTKESLLRSKYVPLKISICLQYDPHEDISWLSAVLDEVLKHSGRIQELRLNMLMFLPAKLSLSTPLLKRLEIRPTRGDPNEFIAITDTDDLRLRTLTLADCSLPWYLLNLSELTTLSLTCVRPLSQPNVDKFLAILGSMQHLTVLNLEQSFPNASDFLSSGGLDVSPRINLPHLTLLALVEPLSTVVVLLSCVDIPLRTQLSLRLLMEPGTSIGDYTPISSFLAKQFGTLERVSGLAFRSLCLDCAVAPSLALSLDCEPPHVYEELRCNVLLNISLGGFKNKNSSGLTRSEGHCIMRDICCSLPCEKVQRLHVLQPDFSPNIWEDILGNVRGLRHMKLTGPAMMPDLSLLSRTACKPKKNPAGQSISDQNPTLGHMVVPALEELELYEITFASDYFWCYGGMTKESLLDALSTRVGLRDRLITMYCSE